MGAEGGQPLSDLDDQLLAFEREARRFSFFRLVYLLERLFPGAPPMGQLGPITDERVRLRGDTSLVFASCDVTEVAHVRSADGVRRVRVTNAFLGLYGAVSPMPPYYAENLALVEHQGGPQVIREFLDVFHHRLLSLMFRAWTKYRFAVMYRQSGRRSLHSPNVLCRRPRRHEGWRDGV